MTGQFVFMNWTEKSARQGRHDVVEYVLPTVPVMLFGVNFGLCFEHKNIAGPSSECVRKKVKVAREAVLFPNHGQP